MTQAAHQLLVEARALIADRSKWIQGDLARNTVGNPVRPEAANAICFCSIGAVRHVGAALLDKPAMLDAITALDRAADNRFTDDDGSFGIIDVNDEKGHEAALACFDDAIKATA